MDCKQGRKQTRTFQKYTEKVVNILQDGDI